MLPKLIFYFVAGALIAFSIDGRCSDMSEVSAKIDPVALNVESRALSLFVELKIKDGWHVYYKDPGDIGLPTTFSFRGKINEVSISWPRPEIREDIVMDQSFVSNIYEGSVKFPVALSLSPEIGEDRRIFLDIEYAVCNEVCIPQSKSIEYLVPEADFLNSALLSELEGLLSAD